MTQYPIQPYESLPPAEPAPATGGSAAQPEAGAKSLLAVLRRRWMIVLVGWLLTAPPAIVYVWLARPPTYTASAQVEVAPVVPAILDDSNNPMPMFDSYLQTQAQIMSSQRILTAALADRNVQDLPLLRAPDPLSELRRAVTVTNLPRTHLLELGVAHDRPAEALRLAKAILDAYMSRAVDADLQSDRLARQVLEKEREQLRAKLDQQSQEIRRLAEVYGASSDAMYEILREGLEKSTVETRQELERAELDVFQLEQQRKGFEAGGVIASEEYQTQRDEAIENDAGVRWVRQQVENETARLARLRSVLPEDHKDVVAAGQGLERLRNELARERQRAAAQFDLRFGPQWLADKKRRAEAMLAVATQRRDQLKQLVEQRDTRSMDIGRRSVEIQNLREQRELTRQEYERFTERLKQLEVESQRPGRIRVASDPEIRPDGIRDRRPRLTFGAALGCLLLASLAALVRDRLDPRVHEVLQVERGLGLPLLGAVPSVAELQAGRVTREHFLESYRLIRTTLSGLAPGNAPPRSILVTSAQAAEGKTSLAVSLAISLAEPGCRVLLIDGDVQAPQIAKLLKLQAPADLQDVLLGARSLVESVQPTGIPGLDALISRGNGKTARSALNTQSATRVIQQAGALYDHVVVDSPPALGAADAVIWAQAVDGVILASLVGHSDIHAIRLACQRLQTVGGRMLGSVIANVSVHETYYSYSASSQRPQDKTTGVVRNATRRAPPLLNLPQGDTAEPDRRPAPGDHDNPAT